MAADPPSPRPTHPGLRIREARALIAAELGAERLAALHKPNLLLDAVSIIGGLGLFVFLAAQLATGSFRDPLWWLALFLQGNLILVLAYIHHDAVVHRKLLPPPLRWVLASLLTWPAQMRASLYEQQHLKHHRTLGTPEDTESYKHEIATPLRRCFYATIGMMFYRAIVLRGRTASEALGQHAAGPSSAQPNRRGRYDSGMRVAIFLVTALAALWDWRLVVYGYLLPFALVTPVLNTLRIILEHFDLDAANPLWVGTFYRTGPLSRLMFWWGAGDCHMVHHYYPSIPFYRIGAAVRAMRPVLVRHGVYEHRSLIPLLRHWFCDGRAYWTRPAVKPEA